MTDAASNWVVAQQCEKEFWTEWLLSHTNDEAWLKFVCNYFELNNCNFPKQTVVDIGSGPIGILTKINAKEKIAVDPLDIDSYDKSIHRIKSKGENIPLSSNIADKVFVYNVLQHVESPTEVLNEAHRITKSNGLIYILEQLNIPINKGHPNCLQMELFTTWIDFHKLNIVKNLQEENRSFGRLSDCSILCLILRK